MSLFLAKHNKWTILTVISVIIWAFYSLTNQLTWVADSGGPSLPVDEQIPLIPLSAWIYIFYYLIVVFSWHLMNDSFMRGRFLISLILVNIISNLIFVFYPTSFPRPGLPDACDWALGSCFLFEVIHFFDTPANCFPSLHVSMSWLAVLCWWNHNSRYFLWLGFWAVLISVSTLTTRQHYLMDVLAGTLLALMVHSVVHRFDRNSLKNN